MIEIVELDTSYKGKEVEFLYSTTHYLDINSHTSIDGRVFTLAQKPFIEPQQKCFLTTFFEDHLENPQLFGAKSGNEIRGYLEISFESWNNRMRISNILILPPYRNQGIGKKLMAQALKIAAENNARAIVLETQSCNMPAINFYGACGFDIIGFDTMHYTNNDIEKREFRLEMGIKI